MKITPKEFSILELLARNQGMVFSNQRIYDNVWKEPMLESGNTVMVHIRNIRDYVQHRHSIWYAKLLRNGEVSPDESVVLLDNKPLSHECKKNMPI